MVAGDGRTSDRILLTGFGPFPGVAENVSADLVRALAQKARQVFPACEIHAEILTTAWREAPSRVRDLMLSLKPRLALHFGVSRQALGFQLEEVASNQCRLDLDATGCGPETPLLDAAGPGQRPAQLPLQAIAERLEAEGLPVSFSQDAGGYLCNAVLYHSLAAAERLRDFHGVPAHSGFIHIPADLARTPLSFAMALEGALHILTVARDAASRAWSAA